MLKRPSRVSSAITCATTSIFACGRVTRRESPFLKTWQSFVKSRPGIAQLSMKLKMKRISAILPSCAYARLRQRRRVNLDLAAQAAGAPDPAQSFAGLEENSLGLLQKLYDLLLRPVSHVLASCEHLIVVPYGMLHYLPFHCLYDGTQYVVERLNISYLPAAALWEICRQRGERVETRKARLCDSLVLGISDSGRLQFAVQEAEVVASQLGARPMLDNAATASLLWQYGARSPIVHIAAHGLFRLDAPNFSHIKLA